MFLLLLFWVDWDYSNLKQNTKQYSQLLPCGHPAIMDTHYYGQNPDPLWKL